MDSMAEPIFITRTKTPTETRSAPTATVSPEKAVTNIAVSDIGNLTKEICSILVAKSVVVNFYSNDTIVGCNIQRLCAVGTD
jgi:hypothetical protein